MLGGLAIGMAMALAALVSWRVPEGPAAVGTELEMTARPTGELEVSPPGPFLSATNLRPGSTGATGRLDVRNQTGVMLDVHLRLLPSHADLDELLVVEVAAGGKQVVEAPLAQVREWSSGAFRLAAGQKGEVVVRVGMPKTANPAYQGAVVDIAVEFNVVKTT